MKIVTHQPCADTNGKLTGYLNEPIMEMENRREGFPAVVVCPGGGYRMISKRESDPVALRYLAAGYQVFILEYSIGGDAANFNPLRELSESIAWIRENSKEFAVQEESIAVCGFSAGGHLAASSATLWNNPRFYEKSRDFQGRNKPNAVILSYAVMVADKFAHSDSISNVSGSQPGSEEYEFFSLDKHVGEHTPPAFIWHTVEDGAVPVENALAMMCALQKAGISYEAHIFPKGNHGISVCTNEVGSFDPYNARWMDMSIQWLGKIFSYVQ